MRKERLSQMRKNNNLNESSLSRVWSHMSNHDCGIISASRDGQGCTPSMADRYTSKENKQRNKQLSAKLQILGYGITRVDGTYVENYNSDNSIKVYEDAFFVVDLENTGKLKADLLELGELYMQDSIMWIPHSENGAAYLIGTNHCPDGFPGYRIAEKYTQTSYGKEGEFMTMINGRPFKFTETDMNENVYNNYKNTNYLGKMATKKIADMDWKLIQV